MLSVRTPQCIHDILFMSSTQAFRVCCVLNTSGYVDHFVVDLHPLLSVQVARDCLIK